MKRRRGTKTILLLINKIEINPVQVNSDIMNIFSRECLKSPEILMDSAIPPIVILCKCEDSEECDGSRQLTALLSSSSKSLQIFPN